MSNTQQIQNNIDDLIYRKITVTEYVSSVTPETVLETIIELSPIACLYHSDTDAYNVLSDLKRLFLRLNTIRLLILAIQYK